jgi:hypothetical protein
MRLAMFRLTETGIFGRRDEYGNALPGAYIDTRPAGTKTTIVRRKLDQRDRLFHLIPRWEESSASCNSAGAFPRLPNDACHRWSDPQSP